MEYYDKLLNQKKDTQKYRDRNEKMDYLKRNSVFRLKNIVVT